MLQVSGRKKISHKQFPSRQLPGPSLLNFSSRNGPCIFRVLTVLPWASAKFHPNFPLLYSLLWMISLHFLCDRCDVQKLFFSIRFPGLLKYTSFSGGLNYVTVDPREPKHHESALPFMKRRYSRCRLVNTLWISLTLKLSMRNGDCSRRPHFYTYQLVHMVIAVLFIVE